MSGTGASQPGALNSPAAERNQASILEVLRRVLPARGLVLEVASGTGQHAVHFARALPGLIWQPSDPDALSRDSIRAHAAAAALANLRPPLDLDVLGTRWPVDQADAVVCINMIHIAPWTATGALIEGCGRILRGGGPLVLYGPYRRVSCVTASSNEAFDASLRARNPQWGLRDLEEVSALAERSGILLEEVVELPANNIAAVFRKR